MELTWQSLWRLNKVYQQVTNQILQFKLNSQNDSEGYNTSCRLQLTL